MSVPSAEHVAPGGADQYVVLMAPTKEQPTPGFCQYPGRAGPLFNGRFIGLPVAIVVEAVGRPSGWGVLAAPPQTMTPPTHAVVPLVQTPMVVRRSCRRPLPGCCRRRPSQSLSMPSQTSVDGSPNDAGRRVTGLLTLHALALRLGVRVNECREPVRARRRERAFVDRAVAVVVDVVAGRSVGAGLLLQAPY